jgi:hypothetical protein
MSQLVLMISKKNKACLCEIITPNGVNDFKKFGLQIYSKPFNLYTVLEDATDLIQQFLDERENEM